MQLKTPNPLPADFVNLGVYTWAQYCARAEERVTQDALPGGDSASKKTNGGDNWSGCRTLDDALRMTREGWQAGAQSLGKLLDHLTPAQDVLPDWSLDVAGAFPCVPAYLTGEPEAVWRMSDERKSVRRLALIVPGTYHAGNGADAIMVYAKAIAAVARAVEASGIDVAIYSLDVSKGNHIAAVAVSIRAYGEPMDLAKIAFAFHPAWLRRISFAWRERTKAACDVGIASCGYGYPHIAEAHVADAVIGDRGALSVALTDVSTLNDRGMLRESNLQELIELLRQDVDAAIKAAGG